MDSQFFLKAQTRAGVHIQTDLLSGEELRITLPDPAERVVVNAGGHGFYRVRYAPDLLERLMKNPANYLTAVERFNLVNDVWAGVLAGFTPLKTYLDLVQLIREEADRTVWTAILASLQYLYRLLDPHQRAGLGAFIRTVLQPVTRRLGWTPEPQEHELLGQLRGELIGTLGTIGDDTSTQLEATALYHKYKDNRDAVNRNVVPALIDIVAYTGAHVEYEEFCANFKTAKTPQEGLRYLYALARFRSTELLEQTLNMTMNGEVRSQDAPYLMRALLLNPDARERAWAFMKEHWEQMLRQYPDNTIVRMCEGITGLATPTLEADVGDFFTSHPIKEGKKILDQYLEQLRIAVTFKEREVTHLETQFAKATN